MMVSKRNPQQADPDNSRERHNVALSRVGSVLLGLRIANALTIRTFFQPDEYFQSLEPAWQLAFGPSSEAWITWEWQEQLRSSLHPILFAVIYKSASTLSNVIGADSHLRAEILIAAPKVLQAIFAASIDLFTFELAESVYGRRTHASYAILALTILSPWQFFASTRTLSNTLETALTIFALYTWPWSSFFKDESAAPQRSPKLQIPRSLDQSLYLPLVAAAIACILRPTNILVWITVVLVLLARGGSIKTASALIRAGIISGTAVLAISVAADRIYYGVWTLPALRFLYFNVVQSLAVFYGRNRPDYYFTEGLPLLLTTALPFAAIGVYQSLSKGVTSASPSEDRQIRFVLAVAVVSSVVILSLIAHKEVRFIYPLLPMLHIIAAKPMASFFAPFPVPPKTWKLGLLALGLGLNVFIASYMAMVHQRGVIDVMHFLRHEHETRMDGNASAVPMSMTVGFFMPCHSTPWRSHFVYPEIQAWALTCKPPLHLDLVQREAYLDEADVFYADPSKWIAENMEDVGTVIDGPSSSSSSRNDNVGRRSWPQYIVFFEHLEPTMKTVLEGMMYELCWRGFNTHWHDDWRRQGDVIVWCRRN